jgi:hypothetical protein
VEPGSSQSTVLQHSAAQIGAQHRNTQVPPGSFHIWPLLKPFGMVLGFWFQNISTTLFLVILEKRASRSHAKTGLFSSVFSVCFLCLFFGGFFFSFS